MRTLLFSIFTFSIFSLQAQFWQPTQEMSLLVKDRILVVEEADFACNPDIVDQLKKHWKLNTEVQGMTVEEIDALLTPENANKYVILTGDAHQEFRTVGGKNEYAEVQSIALYPGEHAGHRNDAELGREWIMKLGMPSCLVSEQEVMFLSAFMNKYISDMWEKPNSNNKKKSKLSPKATLTLNEKTLLIPSEVTEVEETMITKYYKGPIKIASQSEVKTAIDQKQKDSAYLTVVWSDHKFMWSLAAIDCETNEVLAVSKFENFKPSFTKKQFDSNTEFLSIYRSKTKVALPEVKYLGKELTKAATAR